MNVNLRELRLKMRHFTSIYRLNLVPAKSIIKIIAFTKVSVHFWASECNYHECEFAGTRAQKMLKMRRFSSIYRLNLVPAKSHIKIIAFTKVSALLRASACH